MISGFVGDKIHDTRMRHQLTQADLASMAGVSRHTIVNIEQNAENITLSRLEKVLDSLGFELRVLPKPPIRVAQAASSGTYKFDEMFRRESEIYGHIQDPQQG